MFYLKLNRPLPHYAPVRTRLGWTISYKSLYFVQTSHELVHLFTGMWERSINYQKMQCDYYNLGHLDKVDQLDHRKITIHPMKVGYCIRIKSHY